MGNERFFDFAKSLSTFTADETARMLIEKLYEWSDGAAVDDDRTLLVAEIISS